MTAFVLIPGAGGSAGFWSRLTPELEARGHTAIAVDIKQDDPALGLSDHADVVIEAIAARAEVVLVAQSLAGFIAPIVAGRVPVAMIVLLNAMIPLPGESPDEWWDATGSGAARRAADEAAGRDPEFDLERHFLHDLSDEARQALFASAPREPSETALADVCRFERWPEVPIKVLVGSDDRFFPAAFQQRVAKERLGVDADVIAGGHLVAVSNPVELAERLIEYAAGAGLVA